MKKGNGMDFGTLLIILLIVSAIVILLAALVLIFGKFKDITTSTYVRRVAIEKEHDVAIIQAAKVLVVGRMAFVAKGVSNSGEIIYEKHMLDDTNTPVTANIIDGAIMDKQRLSARLVDDSINAHGRDGIQLLTSREWEAMGNTQEAHHDALEYLYQIGLIKIVNGGRNQGTFVSTGTLQTLLRDLAVYALPLATGQKINGRQSNA